MTRNAVNKTTAKATLTQMLSIVFQRMEAADAGHLQYPTLHTQKAMPCTCPTTLGTVEV